MKKLLIIALLFAYSLIFLLFAYTDYSSFSKIIFSLVSIIFAMFIIYFELKSIYSKY